MKNFMKTIIMALPLAAWIVALPTAMTSCADMDGDGIDSILWTGSINAENSSYRNPVWEPSLAGGTILKGSSRFVRAADFFLKGDTNGKV